MSTHAQGNGTHTHVHTQAHALPSRTRDAPDHQGCEREALHRNTAATLNHRYFQNRSGAIPACPHSSPKGCPALPAEAAGPREAPQQRSSGREMPRTSALCPPGRPSPPPPLPHQLDFASPFSCSQSQEQMNSFQSCKPRQRFGSANRGSGCEELGLWTGTLHPTPSGTQATPAPPWFPQSPPAPSSPLPAVGSGSGRPAVSKTRAQAGPLGPRHQLRCHLLLPSQPSRAPAGAGGFESPLCIHPPTDSHSSFSSSLEDPSSCWAAQASTGQNGTSPPNVPPKVSVPPEGGGVSELAFAPLQLTGWRSGWRNFSPAHHRSAASFPKATQLMQ